MKFQNFRFLVQEDMFAENKLAVLKLLFGSNQEITFHVRGKEFFYRKEFIKGNSIGAVLAKKGSKKCTPEKSLEEKDVTDWIKCYCVLFLDETGGQKILINEKESFSKDNLGILENLINEVNKLAVHRGIKIEVNPIIDDAKTFWGIVKKNKINTLVLETLPPNLFGHDKKIVEEAKLAKEKYRANKIKQIMETDNKEGLNLSEDDQELKDAIDHSLAGGGGVILKTKDKKNNKLKAVYNSSDSKNIRITQIELDPSQYKNNEELYESLLRKLLH